ncbi:hypothetical protein ACFXKH_33120 [Streptomyces caelestis]|uniref:hypothetical protein n=1 Tax=Streptomyces caelestis TaxID=36816 RepID=UPI0036CE39E5
MTDDATYTELLGGRVTFTQTGESVVRMTGQFEDGFGDPNADYLLHVGDHAPVTIHVSEPPSSKPFEHDFKDATIDDFTGVFLRVVGDNEVIGNSDPTMPTT